MIRAEMKKYLYFPYLLLAVIGCVVLAFSANADYDSSGSAVSIFRLAITGIAHKSKQPIEYSALFMWIKGMNGWLPLILIANIVFGLMMLIAFPAYISFSVDEQMMYADWYGTGSMVLIYVVKRLIGSFLYGMAASMFGIGAAIFFRDRYMLLCLPFLLNYIYTQILQKLTLENQAVARFNLSNLMNVSGESGWGWTVGLTIVCYVILVLLYYAQVKRRHCDG